MGTEVKYFHSAMAGAPAVSGTAGTLIALLDAILINGFGLGTLDSLVISGSVATATIAAGHSHEANSVALIAGITGTYAGLNGERRVISATATTFTFDATGFANGTATGTITQKVAPASSYWSKVYSGTNLAVYRSTDPAGTQRYFRVDDSDAREARVVGYEAMTGVSTGTGPFPTNTQVSGGLYWTRSTVASGTARAWIAAADSRGVIACFAYSGVDAYGGYSFGDMAPTMAGDAYAAYLTGSTASRVSGAPGQIEDVSYSETTSNSGTTYAPRSYTGLGTAIQVNKCAPSLMAPTGGSSSGTATWTVPYPNPENGGVYVSQMNLIEAAGSYRGVLPGVFFIPQNITTASFASKDAVTGITGYTGKVFKAIKNTTTGAGWLLDITGPWPR